jgi:rubredoxin
MVKKYTIKCKLCNQTHYPIFGTRRTSLAAAVPPKSIEIVYKCPVTGKEAEVVYPYAIEIYGKSIIGWL